MFKYLKNSYIFFTLLIPILLLVTTCRSISVAVTNNISIQYNIPISIAREFRGVWVATVANIDWPNKPTDPPKKQYQDFIKMVDFYKNHNFNAIILQVRTAGDALYSSKYAPWSKYITNKEGIAPKTDDASLKKLIKAVHDRGMEFHAWLNPLRATYNLDIASLDSLHDYHQHPEWMIKYGNKYYYNPGLPEVRQRIVDITNELLENYNIDGIHFDDYFYPYTIKDITFDDMDTYNSQEEYSSLQDWRRNNISLLIGNVYDEIQKKKPWVHFGVSPFGVWRNKSKDKKGSDTRAGQTSYDNIYADPLQWIEQKKIDYLAPQIYWSMKYPPASYKIIVDWWNEQNYKRANLYIGHAAYKVKNNNDKAWKKKKELVRQIKYGREKHYVKGGIFFNSSSLYRKNTKVSNYIKVKVYNKKVLPPPKPSTKEKTLDSPIIKEVITTNHGIKITLKDIPKNARFIVVLNAKKEIDFRTGNIYIKDVHFINKENITDNLYYYELKNNMHLNKYKYISILYLDENRQVSSMSLLKKM